MTWWQALLMFAGIPTAMFILITGLVFRFTTARVPDGLLGAADRQAVGDPELEKQGGPDQDDGAEDSKDD